MKIKCVTNKLSSIPQEILSHYSIDEKFSVKEGKEYIVYAVWVYLGHIWFCICDESYSFYPMWNPSQLFEVVDNRLSSFWVYGTDYDNNRKMPFLSFSEWVNDSDFYDELVDGSGKDKNAIIFKKYKALMDLEFPDPTISENAQIGDQEWLICPKCINAWESKDNLFAIVRCPHCLQLFNNPRYKKSL